MALDRSVQQALLHYRKQPDARGKRPGSPLSATGVLSLVISFKLDGAFIGDELPDDDDSDGEDPPLPPAGAFDAVLPGIARQCIDSALAAANASMAIPPLWTKKDSMDDEDDD